MAAHVVLKRLCLSHGQLAMNPAITQARVCGGIAARVALQQPVRSLWGMLNAVFNKVDESRIKEVGPDRACAEWLLRCGAAVKYKGFDKWNDDYNLLPSGAKGRFLIEEVDATESCIMHIGFPHFAGCNHIRTMKLNHCIYLDDGSLLQLDHLKDSLTRLQVSSCGDVSDKGLASLNKLQNLTNLFLFDLPAVKDIDSVIQSLHKDLPQCDIKYLSEKELEEIKLGKDKQS
ncbi:ATP synthase subunit s, mitochondrial-like [Amphiura filiformis]|uniref:ATP synthase subunit s, mitochondrial-like n=1 Tax=Amphiura filiformis TaxID=82378 RepID=UPI003B2162A4